MLNTLHQCLAIRNLDGTCEDLFEFRPADVALFVACRANRKDLVNIDKSIKAIKSDSTDVNSSIFDLSGC